MPAFPMDRSNPDNADDPAPPTASSAMQIDPTADPPAPLPGRYRVSRERVHREQAAEERLICDIAHLRLENAAHEAELDDASNILHPASIDRTTSPTSYELSDRSADFLGTNRICARVAVSLLELIAHRRNLMEDARRRNNRRPACPTLLRETVREAARAFADEVDGDDGERNVHVRRQLRVLQEMHERWAVLETAGETGDSSDEGEGDFVVVRRKKKRSTSKFSARKCPRGRRRTYAGGMRGWGAGAPDASWDGSLDEPCGGDERAAQGREGDELKEGAQRAGEGEGSEDAASLGGGLDADGEV